MYTNNTPSQLTFSIDIEETSVPSRKKKLTFQPYTNQQMMMIPDLENLIPAHHIARIIDEFVESIPTEVLLAHYDSGSRAPYHPKRMLKVILYGYTQKVYSSHRLANSLKSADFTLSSSIRYTSISKKTRKEVPRKVHNGLFRHLRQKFLYKSQSFVTSDCTVKMHAIKIK